MGRFQSVNKPNKAGNIKPSKGLGDTVEKIIQKASLGKVKSCEGCKKRRDQLNNLIPYNGCSKCGKKDKK
jgi:hypothetical protein